jgi:sterol 3beta-glucosyltransferase
VPSIVTPYTTDQFFWAKRVEELGVGPKSVTYHKLNPENLAAIIQKALTDTAMRQKATEIGRRIDNEHGVEKAVEKMERYITEFQRQQNIVSPFDS